MELAQHEVAEEACTKFTLGGHSHTYPREVNMAAWEMLCQSSPREWLESRTLPEHMEFWGPRFKQGTQSHLF